MKNRFDRRFGVVVAILLFGWALAIHVSFIRAVPDPTFSPDSISYTSPALMLATGQSDHINGGRTPVYPLFLSICLKWLRSFRGVLVLQHALALCTGLLAASCYYRWLRDSLMGSVVVFFAVSAFPTPSIYAHLILAETLYTLFFLLSLFFFVSGITKQKFGLQIAAGACLTLAVLTRPVGLALIAAVGIITLVTRIEKRFSTITRIALGAGLMLALFLVSDRSRQALVATNHFGDLVLFGSAANHLDPTKISNAKARTALQPVYKRGGPFDNFNWVCFDPNGPVSALRAAYTPEEINSVLSRMAWQAIFQKPFSFFADRLRMTARFFWGYSAIPSIYLTREYSVMIYRGLFLYGNAAQGHPELWRYLRYGLTEARAYSLRMRSLMDGTARDPESYLAQIDQQDVYRYEKVLVWWRPLNSLFGGLRWLACLAFLSSVLLWQNPKQRLIVGLFWLAIVLHALLSTMAGEEPRYAVPLLPLYWILTVGGIEHLIHYRR